MQILQAIAAIPRIADALESIGRMMTVQAANQRRARKDDEVDAAIDLVLERELERLREREAGERREANGSP